MTSQQCVCIKRFLIIGIGFLSILAGLYLYLNWIDMFTEMRGKVSDKVQDENKAKKNRQRQSRGYESNVCAPLTEIIGAVVDYNFLQYFFFALKQ